MANILYATNWTRGDVRLLPDKNVAFFLSELGHNVELLICPGRKLRAKLSLGGFGAKCKLNIMQNTSLHFKSRFKLVPTINILNLPFLLSKINTSHFDMIIADDYWPSARFTKVSLQRHLNEIRNKNNYFLKSFYYLFDEKEHFDTLDSTKGYVKFFPDFLCEKYLKPFYQENPKIHQIILPRQKLIEAWNENPEKYIDIMYMNIRYLDQTPPGEHPSKLTYEQKLKYFKDFLVPEETFPLPEEIQFTDRVFFPKGNLSLAESAQGIFIPEKGYENIAQQIHESIN